MKTFFSVACLVIFSSYALAVSDLSARVVFSPAKTATSKAGASPTASVALTCVGPTTGIPATSFNFYRSTSSTTGFAVIGNSATCSYSDATVLWGTTYYYTATAVNANTTTCPPPSVCESQQSAPPVSAIVPANPIPNPPTNLTVGQITATNIPLNWEAPVGQSGITVYSYNVIFCAQKYCPVSQRIAKTRATQYTASCAQDVCRYRITANVMVGTKPVVTESSNLAVVVLN